MQYDDISQLPPKYQEQARRKLGLISARAIGDQALSTVTGIVTNAVSVADNFEQAMQYGNTPKILIADEMSLTPDQQAKTTGKYHNQKTEVDGIPFDSQKEARRFMELREMEKCGAVSDLRLQVNFTLIEGYTNPDGERVKPMVYKADFTYKRPDKSGAYTIYIVEDVKSKATRTKTYLLKRKLMREKFHLEISEV